MDENFTSINIEDLKNNANNRTLSFILLVVATLFAAVVGFILFSLVRKQLKQQINKPPELILPTLAPQITPLLPSITKTPVASPTVELNETPTLPPSTEEEIPSVSPSP